MSEEKSVVVGIDLGTTFSAIAYLDEHGKANVIPNSDNERITPSVVLFDEDEVVVGKIAKINALADPENVVEFVKREMGNENWEREFFGKKYTPEIISSLILKRVVSDAEKNLQVKIKEAVITVPAYFGDIERKATQDAGKIAGLNILGIINEPTAAALAYGIDKLNKNQKVLVYDLGGGTFDVTVLQIEGQDIKVIATDGEVQLGGKDWDDEIINYVAHVFREEHGIDPRDDLDAYQALRDTAEMAKVTLSRKPKARLICQCQGQTSKIELTREKFDELTQALLAQTETYVKMVLEKAKLTPAEMDTILLAGGSTRMPQVRDMLTKVFAKEINDSLNPDECVAIGAALYGTILQIRQKGTASEGQYLPEELEVALSGLRITNVAAHGLGVIAKEQGISKNFILIPEQSSLPQEKSETFGTESDNQTRVLVQVMEGNSTDPEECIRIGECRITDLPPRPAGVPIQIIFCYNEDGRIEVRAIDKQTGKEAHTEIVRSSGLSEEAIEEQKEELSKMEIG